MTDRLKNNVLAESACTGTCNQGRLCDCAERPTPERESLFDRNPTLTVLGIAVACIFIAACLIGLAHARGIA